MSARRPPKRLRNVAELHGAEHAPAVPMRRLDADERRELVDRLGRRHVPLLVGTGGHVLVCRDGEVSVAELWHGSILCCGYVWPRGNPSKAQLVLPAGTLVVFVTLREAA